MIPYYPDTYEKPFVCLYCEHKWYETMQYEGGGSYYRPYNPECRCPECRMENEPG